MSPACSCASHPIAAAAAAAASAAISCASLTRAERVDDRRGPCRTSRRSARCRSSDEPRPRPVADATRVAPPSGGDHRDRVVGLRPRLEREQVASRHHPRRLELGHHQPGRAVDRHHEHRQPLERHRLVPAELRQVGADREQQLVDATARRARTRHPGRGTCVTHRVIARPHAPPACRGTASAAAGRGSCDRVSGVASTWPMPMRLADRGERRRTRRASPNGPPAGARRSAAGTGRS